MIRVAYAGVGLALGAAFLVTRNWWLVAAAAALYAAYPLVKRLERRLRRHDVTVFGTEARCSCGWSTTHAIAAEAERAAERHRIKN